MSLSEFNSRAFTFHTHICLSLAVGIYVGKHISHSFECTGKLLKFDISTSTVFSLATYNISQVILFHRCRIFATFDIFTSNCSYMYMQTQCSLEHIVVLYSMISDFQHVSNFTLNHAIMTLQDDIVI